MKTPTGKRHSHIKHLLRRNKMKRYSARKSHGQFKGRMRKTDKLNLASPRRGGIRL